MYKTNEYKKLTLDVMEVVGSYIISLYYNNMYTTAKMKHEQQSYASITDAYKDVIKGFLMHIDQPEQLNSFLRDLKQWYSAWINNQNADHAFIIDSIVKEYVPEDYFSQLSYKVKDQLFIFIFIQAIKRIGIQIFDINNLRKICDDHGNKSDNVKYFQDVMLSIMIEIRTLLFSRFMNGSVNNGKQDNRTILIDKLKSELIKSTNDNYQMKLNENKYKAIIQHNVNQKENLRTTINELNITNNKLNQAIQAMRRSNLSNNPPQEFPNPALGTPKSAYNAPPPEHEFGEDDNNDFITSAKTEAFVVNPADLDVNDPDLDNMGDFEKMALENQAVDEGIKDNDGNSEFSRDLKKDMIEIQEQERFMAPSMPQVIQMPTPLVEHFEYDDAAAAAKARRMQKRMELTQRTDEETVLRGDFN